MKRVLLFAVLALGLSAACAQKTCPTYATNDVDTSFEQVEIETKNI